MCIIVVLLTTIEIIGFFGVSFWLTKNECSTDPNCCCFSICTDYSYTHTWPDDENISFLEPKDLDFDEGAYSDSNVNYEIVTKPLLDV